MNDQEGVPNLVGVVEDVVGSNDDDTKDSVRVSWKKSQNWNLILICLPNDREGTNQL